MFLSSWRVASSLFRNGHACRTERRRTVVQQMTKKSQRDVVVRVRVAGRSCPVSSLLSCSPQAIVQRDTTSLSSRDPYGSVLGSEIEKKFGCGPAWPQTLVHNSLGPNHLDTQSERRWTDTLQKKKKKKKKHLLPRYCCVS